jgi:hypothetical protein
MMLRIAELHAPPRVDDMSLGRFRKYIDYTLIGLIIFLVSLDLFGCSKKVDYALADSESPSGTWRVSAENEGGGSFGASYDITNVYLVRMNGIQEKTRILSFLHEYDTMRLKVEWISDDNLKIYYGGVKGKFDAVTPGFVAVRFADVNISTAPISK